MPAIDALLAEHVDATAHLAARGEALRATLAGWFEDAGIKIHSITARVKAPASLARKLARPDREYGALWDVTDVLGLRVITYFDDAVDRVGRLLESRLAIDLARSIDKRRDREPGGFGYRSLHYVFGITEPGGLLPAEARGEIQIRTLLEHTWAEIEHDLGYKSPGAVPSGVRRRLSRLAGMLEIADREFVAIREELRAYADALPRRIAVAGDDVALDQLALAALVESEEVAALDRAIAAEHGHALGPDLFFPDYLIEMLRASGLASVAEVQAALREHAGAVLAMARPYFEFAWTTWRLTPLREGRLLRGYALFFVAHLHLLSDAMLQLDKVERLTRLYRELDYPDDPRAAQRVASGLMAALTAKAAPIFVARI